MKKRILAIAFVMLMFPLALVLTACGGGKLEYGKAYVFDKMEIVWDAAEKELFLGMSGMTEEELLGGTQTMFQGQSIVFNEDGTVVTTMTFEGESETQTAYYALEGDTLTVYMDAEKTVSTGTLKVVGSTLVMEEGMEEGMQSKLRVVFKLA